MWRKRRSRSKKNVQGSTQERAAKAIEQNRKNFDYPKENFVTPIEYSLLYSMVDAGSAVYPEQVMLEHIEEEDFTVYLPVSSGKGSNHLEQRVSYGQLSALLSLSAEKFPPQPDDEKESISQKICKKVLNCVIQYAEENDLERQAEIKELLDPVQRQAVKRSNEAELRQALPFYLGYAASLVTANPIPMLVGFSVMTAENKEADNERENFNSIHKATSRRADVEKTGLLDEQEF